VSFLCELIRIATPLMRGRGVSVDSQLMIVKAGGVRELLLAASFRDDDGVEKILC
jgi:hypothetical protein